MESIYNHNADELINSKGNSEDGIKTEIKNYRKEDNISRDDIEIKELYHFHEGKEGK